MLYDPSAPALYLSPHCDDAVLGAWSYLTAGPCQVVTLFAGAPVPGTPAGTWDRLCGYTDAYEVMQIRYREERAALALAGIKPVLCGFTGSAYRSGQPSFADLEQAVAQRTQTVSSICAPAAIDRHPTHVLIRNFALDLAARIGAPALIHADPPYCLKYGWPHWVDGSEPNPRVRPEVDWQVSLEPELTALAGALEQEARIVVLDEQALEMKMQSIGCYESQLELLDARVGGRISEPEIMRYEVFWAAGLESGTASSR